MGFLTAPVQFSRGRGRGPPAIAAREAAYELSAFAPAQLRQVATVEPQRVNSPPGPPEPATTSPYGCAHGCPLHWKPDHHPLPHVRFSRHLHPEEGQASCQSSSSRKAAGCGPSPAASQTSGGDDVSRAPSARVWSHFRFGGATPPFGPGSCEPVSAFMNSTMFGTSSTLPTPAPNRMVPFRTSESSSPATAVTVPWARSS